LKNNGNIEGKMKKWSEKEVEIGIGELRYRLLPLFFNYNDSTTLILKIAHFLALMSYIDPRQKISKLPNSRKFPENRESRFPKIRI